MQHNKQKAYLHSKEMNKTTPDSQHLQHDFRNDQNQLLLMMSYKTTQDSQHCSMTLGTMKVNC
jgi:hypothetical protein